MIYGADTKQLRELAASFALTAQTLRDTSGSLSRTVSTTPWRGGDADQFRTGWQMANRARMESAAGAIEDASAALRLNADEQDRASAAGPDSGSAMPSPLLDGLKIGAIAGSHGEPGADASRDELAAWWDGLTSEEQDDWIRDHPASIGNRDGIPLEARFEANRRRVLNEMARVTKTEGYAESGARYDALEELLRLKDVRDGTNIDILYFDPSNDYVALVHGDLATAREVAVTVSGTGSDLAKFSENFGPEGAILLGDDRAVISTLVWKPPPYVHDNVSVTPMPFDHEIEDYTPTFVNGPIGGIIETAASGSDTVILVGHSAGVDAVQEFAIHGEQANLVDGYALLAPPDLSDSFLDAVDGRAVFVGLHTDDNIVYTGLVDPDHVRNLTGQGGWDGDNVSIEFKQSGAGAAGDDRGAHANSLYYENYAQEVGDLFTDPAANPGSIGRL